MAFLQRILSSFRRASLRDEGILHSKNGTWVLRWGRNSLSLLEAPIRSKSDPLRALDPSRGAKAVRWNWDHSRFPRIRYSVLHNALPEAGIRVSDTAAQVRDKLEVAFQKFLGFLRSQPTESIAESKDWVPQIKSWLSGQDRSWPATIQWYKDYVSPYEFIPKNLKPLNIKGKDFEIKVSPNKFLIYSRYESYPGGDDSYSGYQSKSPAAARKLYNLLSKNPQALVSISMAQFSDFLRRNKIPYDSIHSVWH